MKDKLYKLMDWPVIEGIVYAEEAHPETVLGAHEVSGGMLYQAFFPGAKKILLQVTGEEKAVPMELADEAGFFAVFLPQKEKRSYSYLVTNEAGTERKIVDPYAFPVSLPQEFITKWNHGICYDAYEYLGAHLTTMNRTKGVRFAVWAPNAVRVSVVGDFNSWNGKCHQMIKDEETGLFLLFIPGLEENSNYKYEIRIRGEKNLLKADPYAVSMEKAGDGSFATASVVAAIPQMTWKDKDWMKKREKFQPKSSPLNIYECDLSRYTDKTGSFIGMEAVCKRLVPYLKKMNYTHLEIMPVMEYFGDPTGGYRTTSYYALHPGYGTPGEFMELINQLHQENIGVILDWVPSYFANCEHGLSMFDGTYLYGHLDERQRMNVAYQAYNYNYARPQVADFLISNAVYWMEEFHADGLRFSGLSAMLYLDYGKKDGEWLANLYGGNENLDAIEFVKHVNSILHKKFKGMLTIAKETSAWPKITEKLENEGLGFDYTWNTGFVQDYLSYIEKTQEARIGQLKDLTLSMVYAYSENYILSFSHNEVSDSDDLLQNLMPGTEEEKAAQLRATFVYQMCHPGKKMMYMGQDEGKTTPLVEKINHYYKTLPALSVLDTRPEGFEWIQSIDHQDGVISFLRKGEYLEDTLLIVGNFSKTAYPVYKLGVPYEGKYKELINSQQKEYGGTAALSPRYKITKEEEFNGRINSLTLSLAPLSVAVYTYKPYTQEELLEIAEKKAQKIRERLEKEAISKANALKKLSLRDELEKKINAADDMILKGKEVEKEIKVIKRKRNGIETGE